MILIDMEMPESCTTCQFRFVSYLYGDMRCAMSGKITNLPILDRHPDCPLMEVVKCEDCEHYLPSESKKWDYCTCNEWFDGDGGYQWISPEGYCSYGKRREE